MGANAQTSVPKFTAGQVLTAAQVNLIDTGIPVFATTTTRDAAFGGSNKTLAQGQFAFIEATNATQYYNGTSWLTLGGKVAQVVSTTKTDSFSVASTTYTDVTGLSVSITPTATTSKILVTSSLIGSSDLNVTIAYLQLVRNSTAIAIGDAAGSRVQCSTSWYPVSGFPMVSGSINYLDSPSTTSATTYKIQIRSEVGGTLYINRSQTDSNGTAGGRAVSTITAIEVLA